MMNLLRTTYAELFAVHFLRFCRSRSLQVCASGATAHLALLLIGADVISNKPLCKLLPVFCIGTEGMG